MSDPRPVSESLAAARRGLIRSAPAEPDPAERERIRAEGMAAMLDARWSQVIPSRFVTASFDRIAAKQRQVVEDWSKKLRPPNLVLLGPVGTGKTSAAVAAVRPAFDRMCEVLFAPVAELLNLLMPGGDPNALADFCDVDRLIVDDLGTEKASEFTGVQLGLIVNRRWMEERPTIVTSNLKQSDLEARLGAHTASRLFGCGAVVVNLLGPDGRRP